MSDGQPAPVVRRVTIPAPREEVWGALTRRELLSAWLGDVLELEPSAGYAVVVRDRDGVIRRGLVELVEPRRALVFRWRRLASVGEGLRVGEATRVAIRLEDVGSDTQVTVTEEPVPMVAMGGRQ